MAKKKSKKVANNNSDICININSLDFINMCNERDDKIFDSLLSGLKSGENITLGFEEFALMMAFTSLIQQEERILRLEPRPGDPDNSDLIKLEIQRYVKMRKDLKDKFGEKKFNILRTESVKEFNKCARANLDNTDGNIYTWVIPEFHDDGTHEPLGPKDFPWNIK